MIWGRPISARPLHPCLALQHRHHAPVLGAAGDVIAIVHEALLRIAEGLRAHACRRDAERGEIGARHVGPAQTERLVALGGATVVGEALGLDLYWA